MSDKQKNKLIPKLRFPEFMDSGEWETKKLGEVGVFVGGGTPSTNVNEYWDGDIQWYTPTEIKNGTLKPSIRTITKKGLESSSAKLLPKGAILITTRATIGDAAITNKECATNQGFQSLIVKNTESNLFWYYWIIFNKRELERRASGSTFKEIGKNEIRTIKTFSPSPQEQQKIAAFLSNLDELIEAHKQKLERLKRHKKGLMQNLFPQEGEKVPKLRFPEFKDSGEWVEKVLSQVANYENGKAHEKNIDENGEYIVVNSKYISSDGETVKYSNKAFCLAEQGDILMVLSDVPNGKAIAKCFYIPANNKYTVNQRICKISPNDCDNKFLFYVLNRNKYFLAYDDGVKQTNLKKDDVLNAPLLLPKNINEQQKIASCLSSIDELITAEAEKIEQLEKHKKGLMQGLFPTVNE